MRLAAACVRCPRLETYPFRQPHSGGSARVNSVKFGQEAGSFEHVSAFNPGINPISAAEAAADESLIQADTGKGIHKGREGFQQHPPPPTLLSSMGNIPPCVSVEGSAGSRV